MFPKLYQFLFTVIPKDAFGIQLLTKRFASNLDPSTANQKVKKMIDDGTFAIPNATAQTIEQNVKEFLNWFVKEYLEMLNKEIGFDVCKKLKKPGAAETVHFINKIREFSPRLTVESDWGLAVSMTRRFYNSKRYGKAEEEGEASTSAGKYYNISSVVEFERWWVLKSKIFGQESTYHQGKN